MCFVYGASANQNFPQMGTLKYLVFRRKQAFLILIRKEYNAFYAEF